MAYRYQDCVGAHRQPSKIAIATLDPQTYQPIENIPLDIPLTAVEDPRFFCWRNTLYISFCHQLRQWVVELDQNLRVSRLIQPGGGAQRPEKNWLYFQCPSDGKLYCLYHHHPWTVWQCDDAFGVVKEWKSEQALPWKWGGPRGGTPVVLEHDKLWTMFHSQWFHPCRHLFDEAIYFGGLVSFEPEPPFRPMSISTQPLLEPAWDELLGKGPTEMAVAYPCGLMSLRDHWVVSYGVHDQRCAVALLDKPETTYYSREVQ